MVDGELSLVLLDDEIHIIKLLEALIPWKDFSLLYSGNAHNGIDGRTLILQKKPDIVITDIKMPGLDGLSLISEIHGILPATEFIIISGFSQFDYAKKAITYGVKNYLLKPINKDELCASLEKIIKTKKERLFEIQTVINSEEQLKNSQFESILDGGMLDGPLDFLGKNNSFRVHIIKIDSTENSISAELYKLLNGKINSLLKKHNLCDAVFFSKSVISFITSEIKDEAAVASQFQQLSFDCKQLTMLFPQLSFKFFIGEETKGPLTALSIKTAYEKIYSLIPLRYLYTESIIYSSKEAVYQPSVQERNDYTDAIDCWNKKCPKILDSMDISFAVEACSELEQKSTKLHVSLLEKILLTAGRRLSVLAEERKNRQSEWLSEALVPTLNLAPSKKDLFSRFQSEILRIVAAFFAEQQQEILKPVRMADAYMQKHYSDYDISLEKVSEIVSLTPAYFSALYKKETGNGFLEALTTVRIKKAKELLQTTNENVSKIASSVGYTDIKYFSKVFKKITGIKPNEFRQFYS